MSKTDLKKELLGVEKEKNWRLLFTSSYGFEVHNLESAIASKKGPLEKFENKLISIFSSSLSSDGQKVVLFMSPRFKENILPNPTELCIINSKGTNLKVINTDFFPIGGLSYEWGTCWSPDGKKIAFAGVPKGRYSKEELNALYVKSFIIPQGLYAIDLETRKVDTLIEDGVHTIYSQAWSSDCKEIVYVNTNKEIMIYNLDAKSSRKLADGDEPSWSRDRKWIVFSEWDPEEGRYYIIHPDGSDKQLLLAYRRRKGEIPLIKTRGLMSSYPLWSPDGRYILFSSFGVTLTMREYLTLYIVDFETKKIIKLGEGTVFTSWEGKP